jgi:hypothetical protein
MCDNEVWKFIDGYDDYMISTEGRVMSLKRGKERILKGRNNGHGYLFVSLSKKGKLKNYKIHRLVALAFIDNLENKPQADHIDRNPFNNKVTNLRWSTCCANQQNKDCVENAVHIYLTKYGSYQVQIKRNGERNRKCFKTEQDAVKYRNDVLAKYA